MRKIAVVLGLLGMVTLSRNATAVAPAGPVQPQPAAPGATVFIVGFQNLTTKTGDSSAASLYRGGPIDVSVELENRGAKTATMTVRLGAHGLPSLARTVDVPPKGTVQTGTTTIVTFTDVNGITESCDPHTYSMTLEGPGADTRSRHASIVPHCSWDGTVEDAWASMPPDQVDAAKKGKAYMKSVIVTTGATCQTGAQLRADVENHSTNAGASLAVTATAAGTVKGKSVPFTLAVGAKKSVTLGAGGGGGGVDISVALQDPTHSLASDLAGRSLVVKFARACRLETTAVGQ